MPMQAVDEDEFANRPANRLDRLLFYLASVVKKRDMRVEIRGHPAPQAVSRHRRTKRLPKLLQPAQSGTAKQNEGMTVQPAPKARDAVERNIER